MDKAVKHVERVFGFFSSHLALSRTGRLFGAAAAVKPTLAATTRPQNIRRYAL